MKVQAKHGKVTQNMHGANRNYRYVWDVSICSVKARLRVLVWGSLDILCRKLITSGKVQLSKSRSLPSSKVVVMSSRLNCFKPSMFVDVSSSMVEVVASPLIVPRGLGM